MSRHPQLRLALWTIAIFALLILWDLSGMDLPMARWFGTAAGFPLRDHWLASNVLHSDARRVAWTLQFALVLAIWWPVGVLRLLTRRERVCMLISTLTILVVVSVLKNWNQSSCPWELKEFGGVAAYVSHWTWGIADGGEGHCFPAGHVSSAFCFLAGYFWLRDKAPRAAMVWLAVALLAGCTIGVSQQVRGAHYTSHTLWTAWLCWVVGGLMHALLKHPRIQTSTSSFRVGKP